VRRSDMQQGFSRGTAAPPVRLFALQKENTEAAGWPCRSPPMDRSSFRTAGHHPYRRQRS